MKKRVLMLLVVILIAPALFAVGTGESVPQGPYTEISWRFIDSSVPPQYHRSYTISITSDTITVVVDSYGDLVAKKIYPSSPEILAMAGEQLSRFKIHAGPKRRGAKGCTGGTGEAISWDTVDGKHYYATVYHCAGKDEGTLYGDTEAFGAWCKSLVPDLEELLKAPLE